MEAYFFSFGEYPGTEHLLRCFVCIVQDGDGGGGAERQREESSSDSASRGEADFPGAR